MLDGILTKFKQQIYSVLYPVLLQANQVHVILSLHWLWSRPKHDLHWIEFASKQYTVLMKRCSINLRSNLNNTVYLVIANIKYRVRILQSNRLNFYPQIMSFNVQMLTSVRMSNAVVQFWIVWHRQRLLSVRGARCHVYLQSKRGSPPVWTRRVGRRRATTWISDVIGRIALRRRLRLVNNKPRP